MATPWIVPPKLWSGKTVLILASGPSLSQCLPSIRQVVGDPAVAAIAVNSTGIDSDGPNGLVSAAAPWADMLYGADVEWWGHYAQRALKFPRLKVTCSDNPFSAVLMLRITGNDGYDPTPGTIRTGGNSAYQALHIAAQAGAKRILLCGVDLHARNGSHHHGDHPSRLRNTSDSSFRNMIRRFRSLVDPMRALGVEVLNCSEDSDLDAFRKVPIEEAL